ncbi:hypothetical protein HK405_007812, partial [Cladochytrium tenue]
KFGEEEAKFYVAEVLVALEYLHNQNIVYRDLKPENILLDTTGHIKLADFGFAKVVRGTTHSFCGTPDYIAPEIVAGRPYTLAVDWWSLGVLAFELTSGKTPFAADSSEAIYANIAAGRIAWHPAVARSQPLRDLVRRLLDPDPTRRLGARLADPDAANAAATTSDVVTLNHARRGSQQQQAAAAPALVDAAAELRAHAYFRSVNWKKLVARQAPPPFLPACEPPDAIERQRAAQGAAAGVDYVAILRNAGADPGSGAVGAGGWLAAADAFSDTFKDF